jgi:hypothetical protein
LRTRMCIGNFLAEMGKYEPMVDKLQISGVANLKMWNAK